MAFDDPAAIENAKRRAAGPLGNQQSMFPLRFAKAAYFGERPSKKKPMLVRNATITFVDLGSGPIGVTCAHVIGAYRNVKSSYANVVFQIGNIELDPLSQLIAEHPDLDLATLAFSEDQIKDITGEGEIGSCVFRPVAWPSPPVQAGEEAVFGGFPEILREAPAYDEREFPSWSSGGSPVTTAHDDRFSCQFERENWVSSFGAKHHMELKALSGVSGGPAFVHRRLYFDFVGIIYQFSPAFDVLFLRPSRLINADGTIG